MRFFWRYRFKIQILFYANRYLERTLRTKPLSITSQKSKSYDGSRIIICLLKKSCSSNRYIIITFVLHLKLTPMASFYHNYLYLWSFALLSTRSVWCCNYKLHKYLAVVLQERDFIIQRCTYACMILHYQRFFESMNFVKINNSSFIIICALWGHFLYQWALGGL